MSAPWTDISYPRALLIGLSLVVAIAIVIGGTSSASAFSGYNPTWEGTSDLRTLADEQEVEPVIIQNTTRYNNATPTTTVGLILSPETNYTSAEMAHIEEFVRSGGTLIVAEDFGTASNNLLSTLGVNSTVDGRLLRDERFYGGSPSMPIVSVRQTRYTETAEEVVFNRGTAINASGSTVIARSSNYSYIDQNLNSQLDESETLEQYPVATAESIAAGEVIVIGDPSIFINAMLGQSDNSVLAEDLLQGHESLYVDVSHAGGIPPLVTGRLLLQRSALIQTVIGTMILLAVAYWEPIYHRITYVKNNLSDRPVDSADADPEVAERIVAAEFQDWSRDRVRRITKEVMSNQQQAERDDRD